MDESLAAVRERSALLYGYCAEVDRDPTSLDRAYFAGFAEEFPFASADALHEFLGRYREAGACRFVFLFDDVPEEGR